MKTSHIFPLFTQFLFQRDIFCAVPGLLRLRIAHLLPVVPRRGPGCVAAHAAAEVPRVRGGRNHLVPGKGMEMGRLTVFWLIFMSKKLCFLIDFHEQKNVFCFSLTEVELWS